MLEQAQIREAAGRWGADREARLEFPSGRYAQCYNKEPVGLEHNLDRLDLFTDDSLRGLAARYAGHPEDYFVASGATAAGADFYSVAHGGMSPAEAIPTLQQGSRRILLKRPEKYDPRFGELMRVLLEQVLELRGGLRGDRIARRESAVFLSSGNTITPFHFDPEVAFFFQVRGTKSYHLYRPAVLSEPELERFYVCGMVNIGQTSLIRLDAKGEYLFQLDPGKGLHQPHDAPHWVETGPGPISVSYSFVYETGRQQALGRVRAFNHYLRKLGVKSRPPGSHRGVDAVKAGAMRVAIPLRNGLRAALRRPRPG